MDGIQTEITLTVKEADTLTIDEEVLKNGEDKEIGLISCRKGKVSMYINPVYCIRPNNVNPFGIVDTIKMEVVRSMVLEAIREYLKRHLQTEYSEEDLNRITVMQAECNITLKVDCAEISDVVNLFEKAFDETILYRKRRNKANKKDFEKKSTSCSYTVPKKYFVKIYDKTEEQLAKGNPMVEKHLLRIEIKFFSASLKRMYQGENTLSNILTENGLLVLCREYKRAFEEIETKCLKPYLSYCKKKLYESLIDSKTGNEISETVARHKDLIVDMEVFRRALKMYFKEFKKTEDRSHKIIYNYKKNDFGIPMGVLDAIKMFHNATG